MDRDASIAAGLGRLILTDIRFAIAEGLDRADYRPSPPFLIVLDEFGCYATQARACNPTIATLKGG